VRCIKRMFSLCAVVVLALSGAARAASAETPHIPPAPTVTPTPTVAPVPETITKDPTLLSKNLNDAVRDRPLGPVTARPPARPEVSIKALVQVEGKPIEAFIEIKGHGLFLVREGTHLSVPTEEKLNLELVVQKLTGDGAEIEIPALKDRLLVR